MSDTLDYTATAQQLGLDDEQLDTPPSNYWAHLPTEDIGAAIIDRFTRFRQWQASNGLLRGYRLKLFYYHNEYRSDPEIPHLSIMQSWGEQGQYQYVTINHLRSLLKTVLSSVCQNPPSFQTRAVNSEADALEAAALYQGVLDYYSRQLSLPKKINKAVEVGTVVDQGFILVEWDPFAVDGDSPPDQGIWKGAPSVRVLTPWDVAYDVTRSSWTDLDWQIVRDWVDKEKLKAQFPELEREIDGCRLRSEVMSSHPSFPTRIGPAIGFVKPSAHVAPAAAASSSFHNSSVEKTPRPRAAGVVTAWTAKAASPWLIRANDIASTPSAVPSSSRAAFRMRGPAGFRSNHQSNSAGDIASP